MWQVKKYALKSNSLALASFDVFIEQITTAPKRSY
jgi:hypothetical protein